MAAPVAAAASAARAVTDQAEPPEPDGALARAARDGVADLLLRHLGVRASVGFAQRGQGAREG
ncbi:MAG TPA: hypothetical protein DEF51_05625 [Myxococcales bacterium]|nr:hypothetical protein [Myxococcales bacterium]